jgi:hypothetical protein
MEQRLYRYIWTKGTLPDGRIIRSYTSAPLGISQAEFDEITRKHFKAYHGVKCSVMGQMMEGTDECPPSTPS